MRGYFNKKKKTKTIIFFGTNFDSDASTFNIIVCSV